MKQSLKVIIICLISGIIFVLAGVILANQNAKFEKNGVETKAIITRIDSKIESNGKEKFTVYVRYTVEGKVYENTLNFYSNSFFEGKEITILYMPNDPDQITYAKHKKLPQTLFFVAGVVCVGFGFVNVLNKLVIKVKKI